MRSFRRFRAAAYDGDGLVVSEACDIDSHDGFVIVGSCEVSFDGGFDES